MGGPTLIFFAVGLFGPSVVDQSLGGPEGHTVGLPKTATMSSQKETSACAQMATAELNVS